MLDAFDKRIAGDYGVEAVIEGAEVEEMIRHAAAFLNGARSYREGDGAAKA